MDDKIFGVSERALQLCESRASLLTNNIVNSSTPHYKAKDIDFHKALQNAQEAQTLLVTNKNHISPANQANGAALMYRVPMQNSLDGNTVDEEIERKNFLENAMRYQVNLTFVQNKSDQIMKAFKGE